MHTLTSKLLATLTPKEIGANLFNVFSLFDCSNPFDLVKVASLPVEHYEAHLTGFYTTNMCYDFQLSLIRVVRCDVYSRILLSLTEFKLEDVRQSWTRDWVSVPSFVKTNQFPAGMEAINAMHVGTNHSVFFIGETGYRVLTKNFETSEEIYSEHRLYTSIHEAACNRFMGF